MKTFIANQAVELHQYSPSIHSIIEEQTARGDIEVEHDFLCHPTKQ